MLSGVFGPCKCASVQARKINQPQMSNNRGKFVPTFHARLPRRLQAHVHWIRSSMGKVSRHMYGGLRVKGSACIMRGTRLTYIARDRRGRDCAPALQACRPRSPQGQRRFPSLKSVETHSITILLVSVGFIVHQLEENHVDRHGRFNSSWHVPHPILLKLCHMPCRWPFVTHKAICSTRRWSVTKKIFS